MGAKIPFMSTILFIFATIAGFFLSLRNRVVPTAAEGVAAQNAPNSKPKAYEEAARPERLERVFRASRRKAAALWLYGGDPFAIELDYTYH